MSPRRRSGTRFLVFFSVTVVAGSGCAAISGLDALEVCANGSACGGGQDATTLPDGALVLPDGAVVLPDGDVGVVDGGDPTDARTDRNFPRDSSRTDTGTGTDAGGVDAGDPTFACGTDRCSSNDICCVSSLSCGGGPCSPYVGCVGIASCGPRGGGVCCLTSGLHTRCAQACNGATVCVADSDCPAGLKCTGTDSSLGKTVNVCQ
jgi:hypothetical protein